MIVFEHPFLIILVVPVLIFYGCILNKIIRNRKILASTLNYPSKRIVRTVIDATKIIVPILLIIALTTPVFMYEYQVVIDTPEKLVKYSGKLPARFIFLIDVSPSMYRENRIEQAIRACKSFLKNLNVSDQVVIAVFGGKVREIYSGDSEGALKVIGMVKEYEIKYTSISSALGWAQGLVRASGIPGVVIVLTDGANNYGGDPVQAAWVINASGTPVVFVKVGNDPRGIPLFHKLSSKGILVLDTNDLDKESLEMIAKKIVIDTKLNTLISHGKNKINLYRKDYSLTIILYSLAIALSLFTRIEGI